MNNKEISSLILVDNSNFDLNRKVLKRILSTIIQLDIPSHMYSRRHEKLERKE